MPTHLQLRCAFQMVDSNPKNTFVINPCFRRQMDLTDPLSGTDAQQLVDDMASLLDTWYGTTPGQLTVKAYNLQGSKPNYPLATKTLRAGQFYTAFGPGQLAICLSFYGTQNIPQHRGRLYIPIALLKPTATQLIGQQVDSGLRTKVQGLVAPFAGLGGTNVDWIVWSRVAGAATKVQNYFIDDTYDIIRSRSYKGTTRTTGTTSG